MLSSLSLTRQALLLIAVPLICGLAILFSLDCLLDQAERDATRERHSKEILRLSSRLLSQFYEAGTSLMMFASSESPLFEQRYEKNAAEIPQELNALQQMLKASPEQTRRIARIQLFSARILDLFEQTKSSIDETGRVGPFIKMEAMRLQLNPDLAQVMTDLDAVKAAAQVEIQSAPDTERTSRSNQRLWVRAGAAISVLVAGVLWYVFSITTKKRLLVLMDNTHRVARHEMLLPPVGGRDEIAVLDQTFHSMAKSLDELDQLKQDLVRMASHDLRAPLTSMQLAISLLSKGIVDSASDRGQEIIRSAEDEAKRLIRLINMLLDADRLVSGHLELERDWHSASEFMMSATASVQNLAQQAGIEIEVVANDIAVFVDKERLIQVIINLVSNAIKFSPEGSKIVVCAKESEQFVRIEVRDQGRGVPDHLREKIFERFGQATSEDATKHGGTGLGLYTCKLLVAEHGGTIGVDSGEGQGSIFWFQLPLGGPADSVETA